jgi:orotate phosphoribosyltransferase
MSKRDGLRQQALLELQRQEVLMLDGHFDFGNGFHGKVYVNPHQLFKHPSTIWRFAQDLLDVLPPTVVEATEVVAGPTTGGALLAHTIAGLLDGRRDINRPQTLFAPFTVNADRGHVLSRFYRAQVAGRKVLLVDDVRNTGQTLARCAALIADAGGTLLATAQICDRMEAMIDLGVPNVPLAEYTAPPNYVADTCPLCRAGVPITTF